LHKYSVAIVGHLADLLVILELKVIFLVQELDFLSDRVVSLAFDVISHIMETGPVSN